MTRKVETEIVLGPPGTGKTETLLGEVEQELARGTEPDRIGYVSFTRRAAREAVERAKIKFSLTERDLPYFRTIHSICFAALGLSSADVLEKNKLLEFGDWAKTRVSGYVSMEEGNTFGSEDGDRILFMENLSRIRCVPLREQYELDHDDLDWREVERVAAALAEFKRARHLVDYTDMLRRIADGDWSPNLDVLFVDERQDLSLLQCHVVDVLARGARRVVMAGDDDQAIYRWAGADVDNFVDLRGRVRVLGQSYRVPRAVQAIATGVIDRVRNRRPKKWSARPEEGSVQRIATMADVDLSGQVLILARNAFVIKRWVEPLLQSDGIVYEFRGHASVRETVLDGIVGWERLRRGERIQVSQALRAYDMMSSGRGVSRGHKKLPNFRNDDEVGMVDLQESGGLLTTDIWHVAMDRLPPEEKTYLLRALRKGEKLTAEPRVRVSTIHGSKGGQADHVVLLSDMASRTWNESLENPEDEARVWYVAATRARQQLTIVAPRTSRNFDL